MFSSEAWLAKTDSSFYDFEIENSLLFNGSGGLRFNSGEANTSYWTLSVWVKRHKLGGNYSTIMSATNYGGTYSTDVIGFDSANTMFSIRGSNANSFASNSGTAIVRDTTNWYHYCLRNNNGTVTRWLNGVQDSTYSVSGTFVGIGRSGNHDIGAYGGSSEYYTNNFSLAEFYFINDSGFDADDVYDYTQFAEFKNGVLVPKENTLTASEIGDGGWYYEFKQTGDNADASGVGADSSGNNHHASIIGTISAHCRATVDTPTNNFATYNVSTGHSSTTMSESNLRALANASGNILEAQSSTIGVTSGKWYAEFRADDLVNDTQNNGTQIGVTTNPYGRSSSNQNGSISGNTRLNLDQSGGAYLGIDTSLTQQGSVGSYADGDIIGVALNADDSEVSFYKNGSAITNAQDASITNENGVYFFEIQVRKYDGDTSQITANFGQDSTFAGAVSAGGNSDGKGVGDFKYSVPTGYLALCSANLPEPTISPNATTQATDHFNTILWSGNSSYPRALTGVGFQPDFVWMKARNQAYGYGLFDSARGASSGALTSHNTNVEPYANTNFDLDSFDADGMTWASTADTSTSNNSGDTYVAWNWKAGGNHADVSGNFIKDGVAFTPTQGTINATSISVNTTAKFSIVTYQADSSTDADTVAHALGTVPEFIMIKNRDNANGWAVYHAGTASDPETDKLRLDQNYATVDSADFWNDTAPTTNLFTVHNDAGVNYATSGNENFDYVAYCWTSVAGYSKFGFYIGNGSTDGTFVYTGFKPAFILGKSSGSTQNWFMFDNKRDVDNVVGSYLQADLSSAEGSGTYFDFLSNGFKARATTTWINGSSTRYVYMAFAENPFKYSNAR